MSSPAEPETPETSEPKSAVNPMRRRLLIGAAVLAVITPSIIVLVWPKSAASHPVASTPVLTIPTETPTSSPPAPITPTPTPVATVPHDVVAAAAPTTFTFTGKGIDIKAHVCGMPFIRPLDPPGEQHHTVCWVQQGFGVAPSTVSATTYILGHAWGQDNLEVLNQLSARAMTQVLKAKPVLMSGVKTYPITNLNGDKLTLKTKNGTLIYTVKDAYAAAKSQAGYVSALMNERTPRRIVIITCGELHHRDYDYNIIVDAYLTSSIAAPAVATAAG